MSEQGCKQMNTNEELQIYQRLKRNSYPDYKAAHIFLNLVIKEKQMLNNFNPCHPISLLL